MAQLQQEQVLFQALLKKAAELSSQGNYAMALHVYDRILAKKPDNAQVLGLAGQLNVMHGRGEEAQALMERATRLQPSNPAFHVLLALAHRIGSRLDEAHECVDRALRLRPGDAGYIATKAELFILQNREADAYKLLEPVLKQAELNTNAVSVFSKIAAKFDRAQEALELIQRCLQRTELGPATRLQLYFGLGSLLDSLGRHEEAMAAWHHANQAKNMRYDSAAFANAVDQYVRLWSRAAIAQYPCADVNAEKLIFIVGMPRSGTTLVEQILSSLPKVYGGGERGNVPRAAMEINTLAIAGLPLIVNTKNINAEVVQRHAVKLLNEIHHLAPGCVRFIDKNPTNFALLGLIQLMFPGARIIHCVRNPLDIGLSVYSNNFNGYMPWAYNLSNIGHFYRQYRRMMDHWKNVLSLPMIDVVYEELVNDTEPQVRRLVDFIDVPWDDACLRPHENKRLALTVSRDQVRQPIFKTSLERHKKYGAHLDPLRQALGEFAPAS